MERGWSLANLAQESPWPERIFLILAGGCLVWLMVQANLAPHPALPVQLPWAGIFNYLFLVPVAACWIALRRRKLFLAWPFIFLGMIGLAPRALPKDHLDLAYQLGYMALLGLLLALGEIAGLSLGRWVTRPLAMTYFVLTAGVLIGLALSGPLLPGRFPWQVNSLAWAGVLYFAQALVQLARSSTPAGPPAAGEFTPSTPEEPSI